MIPKTLLNFTSSLAAKLSDVGVNLTLTDSTDDNGVALAGQYYIVVDEGTSSEEHMIVTLNGASGTIDTRGISRTDALTNVAGNQFTHDRGASVKMSNQGLIRVINRLNGDEVFDSVDLDGVNSLDGLATPTAGETTKAANVDYVNSVAIAGAPDAQTNVKGIVEEATQAEVDADTAAGSTGARLFTNPSSLATSKYGTRLPTADQKAALAGSQGSPSNANRYITQDDVTATPTASRVPRADGSGTIDNNWISATIKNGNLITATAGESISPVGSVPLAVYLDTSDGKMYMTSASSVLTTFRFVGFAITNGVNNGSFTVVTEGLVNGFAGLTPGAVYFLSDTVGVISTTAGTVSYKIGKAVSATTLLIERGKKVISGATSFNATTTTVITTGFGATNVRIHAHDLAFRYGSQGGWSVNGGNNCIAFWYGASAAASPQNYAWYIYESASVYHRGQITTTDTAVSLANTEVGGSQTVLIFYEIEG